MQNEKVEAWVTYAALEHGIRKVEGELHENGASLKYPYGIPPAYQHFVPSYGWHRTQEAAIARAEEMRAAKIAALEKQIDRLRKLEFKT